MKIYVDKISSRTGYLHLHMILTASRLHFGLFFATVSWNEKQEYKWSKCHNNCFKIAGDSNADNFWEICGWFSFSEAP